MLIVSTIRTKHDRPKRPHRRHPRLQPLLHAGHRLARRGHHEKPVLAGRGTGHLRHRPARAHHLGRARPGALHGSGAAEPDRHPVDRQGAPRRHPAPGRRARCRTGADRNGQHGPAPNSTISATRRRPDSLRHSNRRNARRSLRRCGRFRGCWTADRNGTPCCAPAQNRRNRRIDRTAGAGSITKNRAGTANSNP